MAQIQVDQPDTPHRLDFTESDPLIVASEAGVVIIAGEGQAVLRLTLTWPEISTIIKKVLDRLPAIIERKVS